MNLGKKNGNLVRRPAGTLAFDCLDDTTLYNYCCNVLVTSGGTAPSLPQTYAGGYTAPIIIMTVNNAPSGSIRWFNLDNGVPKHICASTVKSNKLAYYFTTINDWRTSVYLFNTWQSVTGTGVAQTDCEMTWRANDSMINKTVDNRFNAQFAPGTGFTGTTPAWYVRVNTTGSVNNNASLNSIMGNGATWTNEHESKTLTLSNGATITFQMSGGFWQSVQGLRNVVFNPPATTSVYYALNGGPSTCSGITRTYGGP